MHSIELEPGIFITAEFSVWYPEENTAFIADLHMGHETSMVDEGISLPMVQKEKILERLSLVTERYEPEELVIVGDFKHSFGKDHVKDVFDVIEFMMDRTKLSFVRGNHDNFLRTLISGKELRMEEDKLCLRDITAAHGHKDVEYEGVLILAHEHPAIRIRDDSGGMLSLHCFMHHPDERIIVLPAFDPLTYGRNMLGAKGFLSKPLKGMSPDDFNVYPITDSGLMNFHALADVKAVMPDIA